MLRKEVGPKVNVILSGDCK